jgi:hypothetical protein
MLELLQEVKAVAEHNNEQLPGLVHVMSVSSASMESKFHELIDKTFDVHIHQLGLHNEDNLRKASELRQSGIQRLTSYEHAPKHYNVIRQTTRRHRSMVPGQTFIALGLTTCHGLGYLFPHLQWRLTCVEMRLPILH